MLSKCYNASFRAVRFFFVIALLTNLSPVAFAQGKSTINQETSVESDFFSSSIFRDPINDFTPTYAGPRNGDLDVVGVQAGYTGCEFLLYANVADDIGRTPGGFYVFGFNRGAGTARFGSQAPGVLFDSVVVINLNPGRTSNVTDLTTTPPTSTVLSNANIAVNGRNLLVRVPTALLPSKGFAPSKYTVNLWPRFQVGAAGNSLTDIADFAPDNSNLTVVRDIPGKVQNQFFNFSNFVLLKAQLNVAAPNGSGDATISVFRNRSSGTTQICFDINVGGIATATSAQLRRGQIGETGQIVANFLAPVSGNSIGCIDVNGRNLLRELLFNPESFYITISNAEFPDGAIRGQLSKSR